MYFVDAHSKRLRKVFLAALLALGLVVLVAPFVRADDTVQVLLGSPTLSVDNVSSQITIDHVPYQLTGGVFKLGQIQVLVDGIYADTIPLAEGATTFSYNLMLPEGTHTVAFVGISSYSSVTPTVSIAITYTPPSQPSTSQPASSAPSLPNTPQSGGLVIGQTTAVPTGGVANQLSLLPPWLYQTLIFLDIVSPDKPLDLWPMLVRVFISIIALAMILVPLYFETMYTRLRYRRKRQARKAIQRVIRYIGVVILVLVVLLS